MLNAAQDAVAFIAGRRRPELDQDRQLLLALIQCVQIVGEAAARVSTEARESMPDVPWPAIVGMRNRLVHGYYEIDSDQVWSTVTDDLPPLIAILEHALSDR